MTRTSPSAATAAGAARSCLVHPGAGAPDAGEPAALDDRVLLDRLLRPAAGDAGRLAGRLLDRFGSLGGVAAADPGELARAAGRGAGDLAIVPLLREFAVRLAREDARRRPVIASWTALLAYVRTAMAHRPREQFRVLFLDHRNSLIEDELVAEGTVDHAPVYNAGPERVARLGRAPEIEETRNYVVSVIDCYLALAAGRGVRRAPQCRTPETVR